jgi:phosphoribosylformylglycinamidine synthase
VSRQGNKFPSCGGVSNLPGDFREAIFGNKVLDFRLHNWQTVAHIAFFDSRKIPFYFVMKAKIIVTPKKAVLDPQGKTVQTALEHMGYRGVKAVHVGKYLEIELEGDNKEAARKSLDEAAHKFLSNPVIEDYKLEIID